MDVRRLVAWLSAGILGFQGATLALDLLNCTALSWLYVRRYGLEEGSGGPAKAAEGRRVNGTPPSPTAADPAREAALRPLDPDGTEGWDSASASPETGQTPPSRASVSVPELRDPMGVFCKRPHDRIDAGVSQGLSILAGLALGGSVGGVRDGDTH